MLKSLPNLLTAARIVAIPVVIGLLAAGSATALWWALGVYAAACVTDYFDGWLARRLNQLSAIGRFLDPIADKLLVVAVVMMLLADGVLSGAAVFAAIVVIAREILVSGLREYLTEMQVGLPVSRLAKWKTAVQMIALALLIVAPVTPSPVPEVAIGLFWLAALLTVVTGYGYLTIGLRHMLGRKPG